MKSDDLQKHIFSTYITLRYGIAALAIALPFLLWIGGHLLADLPLQASMSAYYYSGDGAMRDQFVGILCAVGAFLYLYKGVTVLENYALNLAGIFVIGVAFFPKVLEGSPAASSISIHGTCAVLFFLSIAYVCIFRASDTLELVQDHIKREYFQKAYKLLGGGMIICPAAAALLTYLLPHSGERTTIFFVEAFGVIIFALYWVVKSIEITLSNSHKYWLEGRLFTRQYGVADIFKQISVEHEK